MAKRPLAHLSAVPARIVTGWLLDPPGEFAPGGTVMENNFVYALSGGRTIPISDKALETSSSGG